jgi:CO/xanthine dehydrogenase Mo-binding subunit
VEDAYALFDKWMKSCEFLVIGKNTQRVDALDKALGKAKYVEDELFGGMLFARLVKGKNTW